MRRYYAENPEKFRRTPEQRAANNERRRQRYATDPEHREKLKRLAREADKAAKRDSRLRRTFGIGADEFDALLAEQGGGCAICQSRIGDSAGRRLAVDHCHDSGAVRGLLCSACNLGLGKFGDDPDRLERAAVYLRARQRS